MLFIHLTLNIMDIEIIQRISDHPLSSIIKREVRIQYFLPQMGVAKVANGSLIYTEPEIRAHFQVCEFVENNGFEVYTSVKDLVYECSNRNRINPINIAQGELKYITDPETEHFEMMQTERDFVMNLLIKVASGMTVENILKLFIANLDTRETGSVFNF